MRACERCENAATVHLTEIRGGNKTERHLCEKCARSLHAPKASKELQKLLKAFAPVQAAASSQQVADLARTCEGCGMSFAEFRNTGRFGCSRCYQTFSNELEDLLARIHGKRLYCGKTPDGRVVEDGELLDERTRLQRMLDVAVEEEDYEEAARLRDRLSSLGSPPDDA